MVESAGVVENQKPLMSIGWLLAAETTDTQQIQTFRQAADHLCTMLQDEFPQFHWEMPFVIERRFPPYQALKPLPLLEIGVHEKLSRHWDFALVLVPNELIPQNRIFTLGVPSSALEVAVLSTARLHPNADAVNPPAAAPHADGQESADEADPNLREISQYQPGTTVSPRRSQHGERMRQIALEGETGAEGTDTSHGQARLVKGLAALALHLLGHVWGVEHEAEGPMIPPEDCLDLNPTPFPPAQHEAIAERLAEVADARLEEQPRRWRLIPFYWRTFWADPQSIWVDVIGYKPWRLPFRMGRLTAAAAVSVVFLLLGAESWEVGTNQSLLNLAIGMIFAVLGTAFFLFWGQNLGEIARSMRWREQLIRTRMVVFFTLLIGMVGLWAVLFLVSFLAAAAVPDVVPTGWLGTAPTTQLLLRQAAFMATLGVLGGALGGNLEEEDAIKAQLFYDEET